MRSASSGSCYTLSAPPRVCRLHWTPRPVPLPAPRLRTSAPALRAPRVPCVGRPWPPPHSQNGVHDQLRAVGLDHGRGLLGAEHVGQIRALGEGTAGGSGRARLTARRARGPPQPSRPAAQSAGALAAAARPPSTRRMRGCWPAAEPEKGLEGKADTAATQGAWRAAVQGVAKSRT